MRIPMLMETRSVHRIAPAEKPKGASDPPETASDAPGHPDPRLLERFVRGELSGPGGREDCRMIVRHLLAGCLQCSRITGRLWGLGDTGPLVD